MKIFFFVFLFVLTQKAHSWGPQGHMIVGQIAEKQLTPKAKEGIAKLLGNASLASVANWADSIKGQPEWQHTKPWHFVTIEDGQDYSTSEHSHEGDVVSALTDLVKVLRDPKSAQSDKQNALKFIVHFVGDIHQPLHVGRGDDRGGNDLRISFEGKPTNLHALWDTLMIAKLPMDYIKYADYLEKPALVQQPYDIAALQFSLIISECMSVRKDIYNFRNITNNSVVLDQAYYNRNAALMNQQLLSGGKRLAALLNDLFK